MNERIDELMIQSGARFEFLHGVHYDDFQYKTFAELIVRECMKLNSKELSITAIERLLPMYREHFGVEE
jgi:hypothetical protein